MKWYWIITYYVLFMYRFQCFSFGPSDVQNSQMKTWWAEVGWIPSITTDIEAGPCMVVAWMGLVSCIVHYEFYDIYIYTYIYIRTQSIYDIWRNMILYCIIVWFIHTNHLYTYSCVHETECRFWCPLQDCYNSSAFLHCPSLLAFNISWTSGQIEWNHPM